MAQQGGAQVVGNIGMSFAPYRLSQQGWNVMPTARNARGVEFGSKVVGEAKYPTRERAVAGAIEEINNGFELKTRNAPPDVIGNAVRDSAM